DGPGDGEGAADDLVDRDRAAAPEVLVVARVEGVVAVVAHDPDAVLGDLDRAEGAVAAGRGTGVDVRALLERLAVDLHRAGAMALHCVAADRDDPLDQVL